VGLFQNHKCRNKDAPYGRRRVRAGPDKCYEGWVSPLAEWPNRFASCCAVLRSCDDQIQIEPLDPSVRASELISGEPKALFGILRSRFPPLARAPHLRRSKNRRFGSNSAGSTNGAYGRNVRL
jgi:hypothetical protein